MSQRAELTAPEFPIECKCSHRSEPFQLAFARKAMRVLPSREETAFEPTADGLKLLAETEMALERPIRILREVYGEELRIDPVSVRYQRGARIEEPHMGLRLLCAPPQYEPLKLDLSNRGATILDAELSRQFGVLRATAPLVALMGYPARVAELTSGRGQLVMWLSHYAPIEGSPSGGDAAS